ncbi:MAG: hypothetical protein ABOK23_11025 [Candidatus Methanoperedens sp.]|nr:hypothetical protein [Candidatus Methanoperedens sp.]MCZ7395077.1 hypothetical protein [Candidatus Methanoperedens sp.]
MGSSIEAVKHLSKDLGINEDVLIREGIIEFIKSRIKGCMRDRLEIISRYKISSLDEFEKKVREGSIPEHPGWEDLIILENLENTIKKLKKELSHVGNISFS